MDRKGLDPHAANREAAFFFLFVAYCSDFSMSQTFHPLSSTGLGTVIVVQALLLAITSEGAVLGM